MTTAQTTDPTSSRVANITESVTLAITAKAKALRAEGTDVIGFGAGEPDFPTPAHVVAAAQEACADPAMQRYTPAAGLPALREAVARKTLRDSGLAVSPDEVVIANGGKHALYNVFQALVEPGVEVLLPAPYWVTYPEQIRLAGGEVVVLPTDPSTEYRVSVDQLEAARTPRTKLLVFVSPSNPTGAVYPPEQVEAIGRWAAEAGVWVVTDEIYEHLVYGSARHVSMPAAVPALRDRCVVVNGVAKTYAMTGWRVGWSIAPASVSTAIARFQSHVTSNVANVSQAAAIAALDGPLDIVEDMRATYERRRAVVHERLSAIPGIACPMPEGAFYVFPSVSEVLGRSLGGRRVTDTVELCAALLDSAHVALVPGEGFGAPGYVRLSYALGDDQLAAGLDRLAEALS